MNLKISWPINLQDSNVEDAFSEVKRVLPLELINRFDDVLFFKKLSESHLKSIIKHELKNLRDNASQNGVNLSFSRNLANFIFSRASNKEFGARSIKRTIQREVSDIISKEIVTNATATQFNVKYDKKTDKICVDF